jgi:hypothetical protein
MKIEKKNRYKIEDLDIKFSKDNSNCIEIYEKGGKMITFCVLPPVDYGCDIISFNNKLNEGYTYNFGGFIVITNPSKRKLYHEGRLIAITKRLKYKR